MVPQYLKYHSAELGFLLPPIWHLHAVLLSWSLFNTSKQNHNNSFLCSWNISFIHFCHGCYHILPCIIIICGCILLFHSKPCRLWSQGFSSFLYSCSLHGVGTKETFVELKWNGNKLGFLEENMKDIRLLSPSPHHHSQALFVNPNLFFILNVKTVTKGDGMVAFYRGYIWNQEINIIWHFCLLKVLVQNKP